MDLAVTPGYFEALGVPLLRGRYFNQTDAAAAPRAAIVSQTMAKSTGRTAILSDKHSIWPAMARAHPQIRVALGANPGHVVRGFVMKAMRLSGVGIGTGVVLTLCSFRLIRGALYGVGPADPIALGFTLAVSFATAIAACYKSARSAVRIDPMATLRNE